MSKKNQEKKKRTKKLDSFSDSRWIYAAKMDQILHTN